MLVLPIYTKYLNFELTKGLAYCEYCFALSSDNFMRCRTLKDESVGSTMCFYCFLNRWGYREVRHCNFACLPLTVNIGNKNVTTSIKLVPTVHAFM
jgi:hypothetical protein